MSSELTQKKINNYIVFFNNKKSSINGEIIEEIISNMHKLNMFIRDYDFFNLDIQKEEALVLINQYAKIKQFYDKNIDSSFFDNINYLNDFYNIGEKYDYNEYLKMFNNDIRIEDLLLILNNEKEFKMFILDYNRNKAHFKKLEQNEYHDKLKYLVDNALGMGIKLDDESKERYQIIKNNSASTKEKEQLIDGKKPTLNISREIYEYIVKAIDQSLDDFTIARAIYIELGNIFSYNVEYLSYLFKTSNKVVTNEDLIKHNDLVCADPSEFNLKNNKVVCHDWAEIYGSLLKIFNINCIINGGSHSYVEFMYNGLVIEADATGAYTGSNDTLKMYDLSRIKSGFVTSGFTPKNKSKNIKYLVENADQKIDYKLKEIRERYDECNSKYMTVDCENNSVYKHIMNDLKKVVNICSSYSLKDFEYVNLVRAYINSNYSSLEKQYFETINLLGLENNKETMYILFSIQSGKNFEYYLIGKDCYKPISRELLEDNISNKIFIKNNTSDTILGMNSEEKLVK